MDHFFQIRLTGLPPESPMPEAYATLAFLGVGAGAPWNIQPVGPGTIFEAEGLGIPFPSLAAGLGRGGPGRGPGDPARRTRHRDSGAKIKECQ